MVSGALACSVLAFSSLPAQAQTTDEERRSVRITAGIVSQHGIFGDDSPLRSAPQIGPTVAIGIRRHPEHLLGLAFEAAIEPVPVRNPHFDESVSRVYVQLGPEIGKRVYLRPMAGGALNFWSGSRSSSGLTFGPAFTLAAGYRHTSRGHSDPARTGVQNRGRDRGGDMDWRRPDCGESAEVVGRRARMRRNLKRAKALGRPAIDLSLGGAMTARLAHADQQAL